MDADLLRRCEFLDVGQWMVEGDALRFAPADWLEDRPRPVYAFARGRWAAGREKLGGEVAYVGSADGELAEHLQDAGSLPGRVAVAIREELARNTPVAVMAAWPGERRWNGLPVHLHLGLEAGLREVAQPPWNLL